MLARASGRLNRLAERLCFVALLMMIIVVTAQVVFRLFFSALSWSEEVGRYLLVWITFLGASIGIKRGSHMAVSAFAAMFKPGARRFLAILTDLACIMFFLVVTVYGVRLMQLQRAQTSPAMNVPMYVIYVVIPASGMMMLIHCVASLVERLSGGTPVAETSAGGEPVGGKRGITQ